MIRLHIFVSAVHCFCQRSKSRHYSNSIPTNMLPIYYTGFNINASNIVVCILLTEHWLIWKSALEDYSFIKNKIKKKKKPWKILNLSFAVFTVVYKVWILASIVKPTRCTNVSNLFCFGITLYMFRMVFLSVIRSSQVYIQQQAYVKQILLSAC